MQGMEVKRRSYSDFSQMNVTYRLILKTILNVYKEHTNKCKYIHWTSFLICFSIWHQRRYGFNIVCCIFSNFLDDMWCVVCPIPCGQLRFALYESQYFIYASESNEGIQKFIRFSPTCARQTTTSNCSFVNRIIRQWRENVLQQQICSFYRTLHRAALHPLSDFNMLMMFSWVELLNSVGKKLILKIAQHSIQPRPLVSDDFQRCLFMLCSLFLLFIEIPHFFHVSSRCMAVL